MSVRTNLDVWMSVKLGTGIQGANGFREAIKKQGMHISPWADDILEKEQFRVAQASTKINLAVVSVGDLGFGYRAELPIIYEAAKKQLGLELCPVELGPQLRLQYQLQPKYEQIVIGMEPIAHTDGFLLLFSVESDDDGLWLGNCFGSEEYHWNVNKRFAFVLPSKT